MILRPYRFLVKAIPQIMDYEGNVIGEEESVEPVAIYGCDALAKWATEFPDKLDEAAQARLVAER